MGPKCLSTLSFHSIVDWSFHNHIFSHLKCMHSFSFLYESSAWLVIAIHPIHISVPTWWFLVTRNTRGRGSTVVIVKQNHLRNQLMKWILSSMVSSTRKLNNFDSSCIRNQAIKMVLNEFWMNDYTFSRWLETCEWISWNQGISSVGINTISLHAGIGWWNIHTGSSPWWWYVQTSLHRFHVCGHMHEQWVTESTLRWYSLGLCLAVAQVDARPIMPIGLCPAIAQGDVRSVISSRYHEACDCPPSAWSSHLDLKKESDECAGSHKHAYRDAVGIHELCRFPVAEFH